MKITVRHILKNKLASGIILFSLLIGITSIGLIGIFIRHEINTDNFLKDHDRIYSLSYEIPFIDGKIFSCMPAVGPYALKKICGATYWHRIFQFIFNLLFELILVSGISLISFFLLQVTIRNLFGFSIDQFGLLSGLILLSSLVTLLFAYLLSGSLTQRINHRSISIKDSLIRNKLLNRSGITMIQFGFTIF